MCGANGKVPFRNSLSSRFPALPRSVRDSPGYVTSSSSQFTSEFPPFTRAIARDNSTYRSYCAMFSCPMFPFTCKLSPATPISQLPFCSADISALRDLSVCVPRSRTTIPGPGAAPVFFFPRSQLPFQRHLPLDLPLPFPLSFPFGSDGPRCVRKFLRKTNARHHPRGRRHATRFALRRIRRVERKGKRSGEFSERESACLRSPVGVLGNPSFVRVVLPHAFLSEA